jgi:flavin reductase (DIM6/NTAB) family NADH-FMN oxidoreductase RutF
MASNPFLPDESDREPVRRFRGRLVAPVTVVTAAAGTRRAGLTVSSLVVIEGDPGRVLAVVGPLTDLWEVASETGRFVVHLCSREQQRLADVFAGLRPSPGGVFAAVEVEDSAWGPLLAGLGDRLWCRVEETRQLGWSGVMTGVVDRAEVSDLTDPLVHFRGGYRRLA